MEAVSADRFSAPQQLSPAGQSQEYRQCVAASPVLHVEVVPDTHRAVGVSDTVTQHVLNLTSQVALPLQTAGVKPVQSAPVHAPLKHTCPPQDGPLLCHDPLGPQFCGWAPLHCV